jgi:hypothetical protein
MSVSNLSAIVPDNYPANSRILLDASKIGTGTLGASTAVSNTTVIDLYNITPYPTTETINVNVGYAASANGNVNAANGVIYLQDSADNTTFANIATLGTVPIVEAAALVAADYTFKLPPACRRYIKACSKTGTGAGNYADSTLTLKLLF